MNIYTIVHKHIRMYLIEECGSCILFDCGWPDSFSIIKTALNGFGIRFDQIIGVFVSHFHPDHAGSVELLRRHGVRPLLLERQVPYAEKLNEFFRQKKNDPSGQYVPLDIKTITPLCLEEAAGFLADYNIDGKLLYTPGHSNDSISLVVGSTAFVGDLPSFETAESYGIDELLKSWSSIHSCGATEIYPAHSYKYDIGN